jgi:uncharacterized protein YjbJ (UPF0337 family)
MAFRTGFLIGLGIGYVFGAKAGRERYDQIMSAVGKVTGDERVKTLTDKGKAVADMTAERVKGTVSETLHAASDKVRGLVGDEQD